MTWRTAVTVLRPGARIAPVMSTLACCHTGFENTGAKTAITLINVVGRESIAILSSLRNDVLSLPIYFYSIPIFGQSRAKRVSKKLALAN
jgi:hypothetical protein